MKKLIVGISGADGVCIGRRVLEVLREEPEVETHLVLSRAAERNFRLECDVESKRLRTLFTSRRTWLRKSPAAPTLPMG